MVNAGGRGRGAWRNGALAMAALIVAGCSESSPIDAGATGAGADEVAGALAAGVTEEPAAPDASGCNAQLAPTIDLPVALSANGPWQLCGTYGTGGAHVIGTSYDSRRVALLTDSGQVWVMGAGNFKVQGVFAHATGSVTFAGLSPDGKLLATVDDPGGQVAIWNVGKQKLLRVIPRPPAQTSYFGMGAVTFSHDGARVAVVSYTHVDVFDVATGAPLPISSRTDLGGAMSVAFAASDTRLVLGRFAYYGNGPYVGWGASISSMSRRATTSSASPRTSTSSSPPWPCRATATPSPSGPPRRRRRSRSSTPARGRQPASWRSPEHRWRWT